MTAHIVRRRLRVSHSGVALPQGTTNQRTGTFYAGGGSPATAVAAALADDVLLVNPGAYVYNCPKIAVNVSCTLKSSVSGTKAVIQKSDTTLRYLNFVPSVNLTVEDIEFVGLKLNQDSPSNGYTCVYPEGGPYTFIMRRCKVHEWNTGLLAGRHLTGNVLLEDCEFDNNGQSAGFSHNIYVDDINNLTMRGCWSHASKSRADYVAQYGAGNEWRTSWGHLVKCRAVTALLEGNRLTQENGESNRPFDFSNGGDVTLRGNLVEINYPNLQHTTDGGGSFIAYGVEEAGLPMNLPLHRLICVQNTFVNHDTILTRGSTLDIRFIKIWTDAGGLNEPLSEYVVKDNIIASLVAPYEDQRTGAEGNIYGVSSSDNTMISVANMGAALPGHVTFDFTPATPVTGSQNWSPYAYVHPAAKVARTDNKRGGVPG